MALGDGRVIGVEGLVRWQHPREGLLAPDRFLPQIKDTPLDTALGEWVIGTALAQQRDWRVQGVALPVSLNISPRQIQDPGFSAVLARALAEHCPDGDVQLEIEILEVAALENVNVAAEVMGACRALGVRFSLDDFGTGYSSLAYFHQLPIDLVKIDRNFVRNMLDNPENLAIVEGVVRMAKALQRPVLAEGVESLEIGRMLHRLGCQYAQGYGIARPMPPEQILPWLSDWPRDHPWHTLGAEPLEATPNLNRS
jgi:EAL domain-containing protein (putative c-di-GMP-specific phosphodiesterase class I)